MCDRLDLSDKSNEVPHLNVSDLQVQNLLPTLSDERCMAEKFSILVVRTLVKYVPYFKKFGPCLERHVMHKFSSEMAKKSEVVSFGACVSLVRPNVTFLSHLICSMMHTFWVPLSIILKG